MYKYQWEKHDRQKEMEFKDMRQEAAGWGQEAENRPVILDWSG